MNDFDPQGQRLPRQAVQGIAAGVFFMAFFGAVWGLFSAGLNSGPFQVPAFVLVGLVTLAFLAVVFVILLYARKLPDISTPEDEAEGKRISTNFGIVFGIEFGLIALASILLSRSHLVQYIAPVVALIVGVHFFPLARLFSVPVYRITGALLAALAVVALPALLFGPSPFNWDVFVGAGATLILWVTAFFIARQGLQVVKGSG